MSYTCRSAHNFKNEVGNRYGRLTVTSYSHSRKTLSGATAMWNCACDCGASVVACGVSLRVGETSSCGCLRRDVLASVNTKHGMAKRSRRHPLYQLWKGMRARCNNPGHSSYNRYGGRGIKVCERWSEFSNFVSDMGRRPSQRHSVDRINGMGNYEPGNCRWATPKEQSRNSRKMRRVVIGGKDYLLADVCAEHGVGIRLVAGRLRRGWSLDDALSKPKIHELQIRIRDRETAA